jgi:anion-transporting  ArsA/GET3 family ATPase
VGYDLIIVDAPPTGQLLAFVAAPRTFASLVRSGKLRRQAAAVDDLLAKTGRVVLIATPDEMAVTETIETLKTLNATDIRVAGMVLNRTLPTATGPHRPHSAAWIESRTRKSCVRLDDQIAGDLAAADQRQVRRARMEDTHLSRLARLVPVVSVPDLSGVDNGDPCTHFADVIAGHPSRATRGPARSPTGSRQHVPRRGALQPPNRILVVCGSGGTGKTTISAAIATSLAVRGARTILLTVDPAKRLATALGLPAVPGEGHLRGGRPGTSD